MRLCREAVDRGVVQVTQALCIGAVGVVLGRRAPVTRLGSALSLRDAPIFDARATLLKLPTPVCVRALLLRSLFGRVALVRRLRVVRRCHASGLLGGRAKRCYDGRRDARASVLLADGLRLSVHGCHAVVGRGHALLRWRADLLIVGLGAGRMLSHLLAGRFHGIVIVLQRRHDTRRTERRGRLRCGPAHRRAQLHRRGAHLHVLVLFGGLCGRLWGYWRRDGCGLRCLWRLRLRKALAGSLGDVAGKRLDLLTHRGRAVGRLYVLLG